MNFPRLQLAILTLSLTGTALADPTFSGPDLKPGKPDPTAPATAPTTGPATLPVITEKVKIDVKVKSAVVGLVPIRKVLPPGAPKPKFAASDRKSDQALLILKVEIHNDCLSTTLTFDDLDNLTPETSPGLEDALGNGFPSVHFGDWQPIGAHPSLILKPGETGTDVLIFAPPPADVSPLHLRMPKKMLGRTITLEADIDPKEVKR